MQDTYLLFSFSMNKLILQFVNRPTNMLMFKFNLQIVNDFSDVLFITKVIRLQRSGIDTIKYHTRSRIPMGK